MYFFIIKAKQLLLQTELRSWFLKRRSIVFCYAGSTILDVPLSDQWQCGQYAD